MEVKEKFNTLGSSQEDYEYERWFKTPLLAAGYDMTREFIEGALRRRLLKFSRYFELGPGAGTWTKLFLAKYPEASFDLVDISEKMLELAKSKLRDERLNYFCSDFLDFNGRGYDFFFSSRAIEYIPDKDKLGKKISELLIPGSVGIIITKLPHYRRALLAGRGLSDFHQKQIGPSGLKDALEKHGLKVEEICPVTVNFPFMRSAVLNRILSKFLLVGEINFISRLFTESYGVIFKKI